MSFIYSTSRKPPFLNMAEMMGIYILTGHDKIWDAVTKQLQQILLKNVWATFELFGKRRLAC